VEANNTYNLNEITRLKNFPISFLAICPGLIGFTLAWQKAEHILSLPFSLSNYLLFITIVLFAVIASTYLLKIIKYPQGVKKEFDHPIKLNFYPILAKCLLIASLVYLPLDVVVSKYLWWLGVIAQSIFTLVIMSMVGVFISLGCVSHRNLPDVRRNRIGFLLCGLLGDIHFLKFNDLAVDHKNRYRHKK
jgi:hypothetical protein